MIIPCIDLQDGRAVQLVQGRGLALAVDDVLGLLERFRCYPVVHVIDLDAALRQGRNGRLVRQLCERASQRVRVGGGIRTAARAKEIVRWGAEKVIIGSAAFHRGRIHRAFLHRLVNSVGRRRIILALDATQGFIAIRGWREKLHLRPEEVMPALDPFCAGFLCTAVDHEGKMRGTDLAWFRQLRAATDLPIIAAGGIRSRREVDALARLNMDAAVGMALYLNHLQGEVSS